MRDPHVETRIEVIDTQSMNGNLDDAPITNRGRIADPHRFFFLNDPLGIAIYTREEPIASGAATVRANEKHRAHLNSASGHDVLG